MKLKFALTAIAFLSVSLAIAQSNTLKAGEALVKGKTLTSQNGIYSLEKSPKEGVFNIYTLSGGYKKILKGLTGGSSANDLAQLILQTDGNLVVYDDKNVAKWVSKTQGYFETKYNTKEFKPVKGVLENDGTFVLYSATGNAVWKR